MELEGTWTRKWNAERAAVCMSTTLCRTGSLRKASDIRRAIDSRLQMWDNEKHLTPVQHAEGWNVQSHHSMEESDVGEARKFAAKCDSGHL